LEELNDVVGVYLTPPQIAVALCVDETSQIQALERTQPGLLLEPAAAALSPMTTFGTALPRCSPRSKWAKAE
jgi:hypothetical protein